MLMNTNNNFDLVQQLLALPWYNLILISLLVIPLFIAAWITLLTSLNITLTEPQKKLWVGIFIGVYTLGLVVGKYGHEREQKAQLAEVAETIRLDLQSNGGIMGFNKIREKHPAFTSELLYRVADTYSKDFEVTSIGDPSAPTRRDPSDPFGIMLRKGGTASAGASLQ
jgi:hypothetical protein